MSSQIDFEKLNNRYFVMRHGQSRANEQGLINSDPSPHLQTGYGLTNTGRTHVLEAARDVRLNSRTIIYSSPFARANETAEIVRSVIGAGAVKIADELSERDFGNLDGSHHSNYYRVWANDVLDPNNPSDNVEPVSQVFDRTDALIHTLESKYKDKEILLVSHGDTLQILLTGLKKIDLRYHRNLPSLGTAEIRDLYAGNMEPALLTR